LLTVARFSCYPAILANKSTSNPVHIYSIAQYVSSSISLFIQHKPNICSFVNLTCSIWSTLKKPAKNYTCFILRRFGLFLIHLQSKIILDNMLV